MIPEPHHFMIFVCLSSIRLTDATKSAFLAVDVQNCFTSGGTLAVPEADDVIPVINDLRERLESRFDIIIFSQDWHCANHVSFASQHEGYDILGAIELSYNTQAELCRSVNVTAAVAKDCSGQQQTTVQQSLWPDHCVINTTDADFCSDVIMKDTDTVIQKGYDCGLDSYSMFYDNGHFRETALRKILAERNVTRLYITGIARDYCVYWTAKDGKDLGFDIYVIIDATRGVAKETSDAAITDMRSRGIHVINSTDVEDTFPEVDVSAGQTTHHDIIQITIGLFVILWITYNSV